MKKIKHGFIGLGKMAEILLKAFLKEGLLSPQQVIISRRDPKQRKRIASSLKVSTTASNLEVVQNCDWIWLGIKPFQAGEILQELKPYFRPGQIVLSMMAGVSASFLKKFLQPKVSIVRLMPNTPSLLGLGATGIYFSKQLSAKDRQPIIKMLNALGLTEVVKQEDLLDAVTGLSGSGPAFVYEVARGFISGGISAGLSPEASQKLAIQTLLGAAKMLELSGKNPVELIAQVVSKGGTTEAGLKILEQKKLQAILSQAVSAAANRAEQIREEFEKCM